MNVAKNKEQGFTIIEVVLVLAIAALIFLMVFIALPALQRSQRDTGRKSDVGTVAAAVTSFAANNKGKMPTTPAEVNAYADNLPDGVSVVVRTGAQSAAASGATTEVISVVKGVKCATNGATTTTGASSRNFAVVTKLEGGNDVYYCQES